MRKWLVVIGLSVAVGMGGWMWRSQKWDGRSRFTVIWVGGEQIRLESFDPVTHEGVRVILPENLEVESAGGRGNWMAGVISKAGKVGWVADSVAETFGVVYTANGESLGWWDKWRWERATDEVTWTDIDLVARGLVDEEKTVDGLTVLGLNKRWDSEARGWFYDSRIVNEGLEVKIVNATEVVGLGGRTARILESSGIKVGMITNNDKKNGEGCVVITREEDKNKAGIRMIRKALKCRWVEGEGVATVWLN